MVVLNTCCIRENADQRLYGTLGQAQGAGRRQARPADRRRGMPGPEGPRADPGEGGLGRRRVRHPQPDERAGVAPAGPDRGPRHGDPRCAIGRVRRQPAARSRRGARGALCRLGEHPDRVRQLLCLLHRALGPRARSQPAGGRHRGGGGVARPPRRDRGDVAGTERQLLRPRHHEAAPALRVVAASGGRRGGDRTDPLHEPAPEGPAARDDRGDGRDARGVRAAPPAASVRERPGVAGHAAGLHGAALSGAARRRPRRHR